MYVYFVRHGSTAGNETNAYQGSTLDLSEKGIGQAKLIAERFESIPVDAVISSSMTRAAHTAQIISEHIGHTVIESPLFAEVKRPSIVVGRNKGDAEVKSIMQMVKETFADPLRRHSDEEDYFDLEKRAGQAMEFILEQGKQKVLVVTHGEFLKVLLARIIFGKELTPELCKHVQQTFVPYNTGITVVEHDMSYKVHESGWYVVRWNDSAHLGEVKAI